MKKMSLGESFFNDLGVLCFKLSEKYKKIAVFANKYTI